MHRAAEHHRLLPRLIVGRLGGRTDGIFGDIARLLSPSASPMGDSFTLLQAVERVVTRPGPNAIALYRFSHWLWCRGAHTSAELVRRVNVFLTGADIHPAAELGGGLFMTHTSGVVIGRGAKVGANVTILHDVTLGISWRGWFDPSFVDGCPIVGDGTVLMAGAKTLRADPRRSRLLRWRERGARPRSRRRAGVHGRTRAGGAPRTRFKAGARPRQAAQIWHFGISAQLIGSGSGTRSAVRVRTGR